MSNRKKILLITNYKPNTGGISVQVGLLHRKLCEESIQSEIFSTEGTWFYRLFVLLKLIIKGKSFDIFHIHGCSKLGFFPIVVGVIAGKILRKKIIVTYHGGGAESFFEKHTFLVRYFLTKTDANIVLSGFLSKVFDKYTIPYTIIPNIVELSEEQFFLRETILPHYISVRTLSKTYNIGCILNAFNIVQQKYPESTLTLLGDGDCREKLEEQVKELNLQNVHFVGKVSNSEIYNYLSKADVFVSSPIVDNQPMSILEAYNAGLLVISSRVGGVPYMVEDNKTGLLFESNDYQELAKKMIIAVQEQELSKNMILKAKNELKNYSWEKIKEKLLPLYFSK